MESVVGVLALTILLRLAAPVLITVGAALFLRCARGGPAAVMLTGAVLSLLLSLLSVAMHPLFPWFRHIPTELFARLSMGLGLLGSAAGLLFAAGFVAQAVFQNTRSRPPPEPGVSTPPSSFPSGPTL